ncbi:MAG: hypothetical protein JXA43_01270, partial [Candidatus Diapherotrites archaeon]|nr:hypothetical protein [Candidatus Diapherotrites archaeon]
MEVRITFNSEYKTEKEADAIAKALEVDNKNYNVETKAKGKKIISNIKMKKIGTAKATADDLIA